MDKRIVILAGPNGAGKTTFAREFLVREISCPAFVNADLIAAGLSPFDPERMALRAGRLMLELIEEHVARGESFTFETTLAGRNFARAIDQWRSAGYHVALIFLSLPSAELAIQRVAQRVRQGGHAVPDEVVRRRFSRGREHFETLYKPLVGTWMLYDNAGESPILIAAGGRREAMTTDAAPPPFALEVLEALRRARLRAIEIARAANTCLVVWRNGQIVLIPPDELPIER
jgi:predicted ABC-type ATPase